MKRIVVVDNEAAICELIQVALESEGGYEVAYQSDPMAAARLFAQQKYDLALIDIVLPGLSGFDLACMALGRGVRVLLMTGNYDTVDAMQKEGLPCLQKPFRLTALIGALKQESLVRPDYPERLRAYLVKVVRRRETAQDILNPPENRG